MPALQVKDCPQDVYERLRAYAGGQNRSIAQQTLTIIQEYLDSHRDGEEPAQVRMSVNPSRSLYTTGMDEADYRAKRKRAFERIAELPPLPIGPASPAAADILAQIREEEAR